MRSVRNAIVIGFAIGLGIGHTRAGEFDSILRWRNIGPYRGGRTRAGRRAEDAVVGGVDDSLLGVEAVYLAAAGVGVGVYLADYDQFGRAFGKGDDIASALFLVVSEEWQKRQIYNVVDDQPMLRSDCYRWLAQRLNRPLPPIRELTEQRKRGDTNKRVSNAKLRSLGWTLQYPTFADAMEKSILPGLSEIGVPLSPKRLGVDG